MTVAEITNALKAEWQHADVILVVDGINAKLKTVYGNTDVNNPRVYLFGDVTEYEPVEVCD